MPNSPKTPEEIVAAYQNDAIMKEYGMTVATGDAESAAFYRKVVSESRFAYCIFASSSIIEHIGTLPMDKRHYLMDATFHVVPYGDFSQLLVIHATFIDKVRLSSSFFLVFTVSSQIHKCMSPL